MEAMTCEAPAGTSKSNLIQFPRISDDEQSRKGKESTITIFPRNLIHSCFSFLNNQKPKKKHRVPPRIQSPSRRILQIPQILPLWHSNMYSLVDALPYEWPHDDSFDPKTTALVIIDMQKDFCSLEGYMSFQGCDISAAREIIPRVQNLLTTFRAHGFPIYHTREGHRPDLSTLSSRELTRSKNNESGKGIGDQGPLGRLLIRGQPGHDIIPELYPLPGENVIDKPGRSAFQHTEFGLMLKIKGIKNLIICGVTTDVCVHSTMREANDNGFDCLLVEDATAASEPHLHAGAVESVKAEGGIFGAISTTDRILAALEVKKEEKANEPVGNGADIKVFDPPGVSGGTSRGMPMPQQMFPPPDVMGGPPRSIPQDVLIAAIKKSGMRDGRPGSKLTPGEGQGFS